MTNLKYTILLLCVGLLMADCNEDEFLDYQPFGRYSVENFFETEEQAVGAVNGIYPNLRSLYNQSLWKTVEMRSDNTTFIPNPSDRGTVGIEEIDYFVLVSSSGIHGQIWNPAYKGITNANYVINEIDDIPFNDPVDRDQKKAEATFLRAFYYYILTQTFGDVVKITENIESEEDAGRILAFPRSPRSEVLDQIIIPDLEFAVDNLPAEWTGIDQGRATKGAAQMLLAKIYFTDQNYTEALPLLDDIIDSGLYEIQSDYRALFGPGNQSSSEIIFANQFSVTAGQGAGFFLSWLPYQSGTSITDGVFVGTGASKNIPTCDLIDAYPEGDLRKAASIGFYDPDENDPDDELIPYCRKYIFPPITGGGSDFNFPVFRYADVLLMKAEALQETEGGLTNEVFELVNLLRVRAQIPLYFPGNPNPEFDISSPEQLVEAIRKERRLELAFENHRFWDLMRYGNVEEVMSAHGEEQKVKQDYLDPFPEAYQNIRTLFAIPFDQVDRWGYSQNPGW